MNKDYRYILKREFGPGKHVVFIGLNPSTADDSIDDPTIRRMMRYARDWGFGSMSVVNLFAIRATKPTDMVKHSDPIGIQNDSAINSAVDSADLVVACWGNHGSHMDRDVQVRSMVSKLYYIDLTKQNQPAHPLYLKKELKLKLFHIVV